MLEPSPKVAEPLKTRLPPLTSTRDKALVAELMLPEPITLSVPPVTLIAEVVAVLVQAAVMFNVKSLEIFTASVSELNAVAMLMVSPASTSALAKSSVSVLAVTSAFLSVPVFASLSV